MHNSALPPLTSPLDPLRKALSPQTHKRPGPLFPPFNQVLSSYRWLGDVPELKGCQIVLEVPFQDDGHTFGFLGTVTFRVLDDNAMNILYCLEVGSIDELRKALNDVIAARGAEAPDVTHAKNTGHDLPIGDLMVLVGSSIFLGQKLAAVLHRAHQMTTGIVGPASPNAQGDSQWSVAPGALHNPEGHPTAKLESMTAHQLKHSRWVNELAMEALNAACYLIQQRLGVETGDLAGIMFSGDEVLNEFVRYIQCELDEAASHCAHRH